jgi:hypothetical protein
MLVNLSNEEPRYTFGKAQKEYRRQSEEHQSSEDEQMEEVSEDEDDEEYSEMRPNKLTDDFGTDQERVSPTSMIERTFPPGSPTSPLATPPSAYLSLSPPQATPFGSPQTPQHKSKKRKNEAQMGILMAYYKQMPDPDLNMKKKIAEETSLTVKQVSDWFYNLRVRKKWKVN